VSVHLPSDLGSDIRLPWGGAGAPDELVAESNHRIANNLAMIAGMLRMHAAEIAKLGQALSAEDACLLLQEVGSRIQTVAQLHRSLVEVERGSPLDLRQYLRDISEAVVGNVSGAGAMTLVQTSTATPDFRAEQALRVGFIVGELVINAIKYSHPTGVHGRIEVGCHERIDGMVLIQVTDDGVGLPENFDPKRDGGLGMRMVRVGARRLDATLTFDSSALGLTVSLLIPPLTAVS
jgi:two-component sensor histidine kinase